jgi:hypothetical protein
MAGAHRKSSIAKSGIARAGAGVVIGGMAVFGGAGVASAAPASGQATQALPTHLTRQAAGNSGAICYGGGFVDSTENFEKQETKQVDKTVVKETKIVTRQLSFSDRNLKADVTPVDWSR